MKRKIILIASLVMTFIISDTLIDIYKCKDIRYVYNSNGVTYIHINSNKDSDIKRAYKAIRSDGKKIVRVFKDNEYVISAEIDLNNNIDYIQGA